MKRLGLIVLLLAVACAASKPKAATQQTSPPASATESQSLTQDDFASDMATAVTDSLKSHGSTEEAAFGQVQADAQYGNVLILHMNANSETTANAAGFALLAFAEAAGAKSDEVSQFPSIEWASLDFGGGAQGRLYIKFADALDYAAGNITAAQLRQRAVFP